MRGSNRSQGRRVKNATARVFGACVMAGVVLLAGACKAQPASPNSASPAGLTPRAYVPAFSSAAGQGSTAPSQSPSRRVLFVQGDFVPSSGYPQSRVSDDGTHPESFTRLRTEVLEGELKLAVDETVLTKSAALDKVQFEQYSLVVLGSNARPLTKNELAALTAYYSHGGSVLVYADAQYGPAAWDSDNSFLSQFGILVLTDNSQPTVDITDVETAHPIFAGVKDIRGEGISQFRVSASALSTSAVIARCSPLTRSGCILPQADQALVKKGDAVACVFTRENAAGGRLAGVCDRNFFQNGPGPGSDLDQADNHLFASNLFRWLSKS
ncbi:MAG TPA: hypothetical protein VGK81_11135 [Anaerolineae bacterium]